MFPLLVQLVFFFDETLNMIQDRLICALILHESLLPRGWEWNGQAFMLRPPESEVNRATEAWMTSFVLLSLLYAWYFWHSYRTKRR
jgi:hypothetical protein